MAKTPPKKSSSPAAVDHQGKSNATKDPVKTATARSDDAGRKKDSGKKSR